MDIGVCSNGMHPPINNLCAPDIYNKLDADVIEKARVFNSMLEIKLQVQEKVLAKNKFDTERMYLRETNKLKTILRNIVSRLPNYADIPHLETKLRKLRKKRRSNSSPKHNCVFTTKPLDMKGLADEKDEKPFCDRFYVHHLTTKSHSVKTPLPLYDTV